MLLGHYRRIAPGLLDRGGASSMATKAMAIVIIEIALLVGVAFSFVCMPQVFVAACPHYAGHTFHIAAVL